MKKLLAIFGIVFAMLSAGVLAQNTDLFETGEDYTGAPIWDFIKPQSSPFSFTPLTVVSGALCTSQASWEKLSVISSNINRFCWSNTNGGSPGGNGVQHQGVAYQVFLTNQQGGVLGTPHNAEVLIPAGQDGCIRSLNSGAPITGGTEYYRTAYYCDDTSKTCTKYYDVCQDGQNTLRERSCTTNGITSFETTWVSYVDTTKNTISCSQTTGSVCTFSGNTCDKNGRVISCVSGSINLVNSCSTGQCSQGVCITKTVVVPPGVVPPPPLPPPPGSSFSGTWSNVRIPTNVEPNADFVASATFTANTAGTYYLEAGIFNRQLSVVTARGSKCDGSLNFAGEFVNLQAGQTVEMIFQIEAVSSPGIKSVIVGAYTNCFSAGGQEITSEVGIINVLGEANRPGGGFGGFGGFNFSPILVVSVIILLAGVFIKFQGQSKGSRA